MQNNLNPAEGFTVSRILRASPEQNEMSRRNYSRIFIMPVGEGFIDSILSQGYRPIEGYADVAKRAIALSGLVDISGLNEIRPINRAASDGFLQSHFASIGWLEAEDKTVYDLVVEVIPQGEELPTLDFNTTNARMLEGYLDNPVIISVETSELSKKFSPVSFDNTSVNDQAGETAGQPAPEPSSQDNDNAETSQDMAASTDRTPGRVTNPETDRRLKRNRQGSDTAMQRSGAPAEDRSTGDAGRMAGKPGRVRHPMLDGRRKENRRSSQPQQAAAGGR